MILIFIVFLAIARLLVYYRLPDEFQYEQRPSPLLLCSKLYSVALFRQRGTFAQSPPPSQSTDVDLFVAKTVNKLCNGKHKQNKKHIGAKITCLDCRIAPETLMQYAQICGYSEDVPLKFLPPCFLHIYFIPLIIQLTLLEDFKLSPLGLVPIRQRVTQHCDLHHLLKEPCDLECFVSGYCVTGDGVNVSITMKVYDRRELCVWESVTILQSCDETLQTKSQEENATTPWQDDITFRSITTTVPIPEDIGQKYARLSVCCFLTSFWTSLLRIIGYQVPDVFRMWLLARCLVWITEIGKMKLGSPFHLEVQFQKSLSVDEAAVFKLLPALEKCTHRFCVTSQEDQDLHLTGCLNLSS